MAMHAFGYTSVSAAGVSLCLPGLRSVHALGLASAQCSCDHDIMGSRAHVHSRQCCTSHLILGLPCWAPDAAASTLAAWLDDVTGECRGGFISIGSQELAQVDPTLTAAGTCMLITG